MIADSMDEYYVYCARESDQNNVGLLDLDMSEFATGLRPTIIQPNSGTHAGITCQGPAFQGPLEALYFAYKGGPEDAQRLGSSADPGHLPLGSASAGEPSAPFCNQDVALFPITTRLSMG